MNTQLEKFAEEVITTKAKILDDFCKTYIAARSDFFLKNPKRLSKLELVEKVMPDGVGRIYSFRVKPRR